MGGGEGGKEWEVLHVWFSSVFVRQRESLGWCVQVWSSFHCAVCLSVCWGLV